MRGRKLLTAVSVICVLAQLGLGASSALGLVLCVGADHTAVELPSDDCCAGHGGSAGRSSSTLEASCCDDVPLAAAWRSVSDVRRLDPSLALIAAVASPLPVAATSALALRSVFSGVWSPPPLALRPAILRV